MANTDRLGVLPVQRAVAQASPSFWQDLIVTARSADQVEAVALDGARYRLVTSAEPQIGEPIAVHSIAELLARGGELSTARMSAAA